MATTPVDPASPWPQFRRTADQRAASPLVPVAEGGREPWRFATGKGVFSTPVIDGEGTAYVGSADHTFYAIDRAGDLKGSFETGEIIDSAALLDDRGRVYVPSGDGTLYALDREGGGEIWRFEADPPGDTGAFIDWFEGNVAMGAAASAIRSGRRRRSTSPPGGCTSAPTSRSPTTSPPWTPPPAPRCGPPRPRARWRPALC
jgi:hypothetical protein